MTETEDLYLKVLVAFILGYLGHDGDVEAIAMNFNPTNA